MAFLRRDAFSAWSNERAVSKLQGEPPAKPIRPYVCYTHTVHYICIEQSLLLAFTTGKKDATMQLMARWLFHTTIQGSLEHVLKTPELAQDWTVNRLCSHFNVSFEDAGTLKDIPLGRLDDSSLYRVCAWARTSLPGPMLTYYESLHNYDAFTREKMHLFVTGKRAGKDDNSPYPDDLSFATRTTERVILKPRPLEVLVQACSFTLDEIHPTLLARHIRSDKTDPEWLEDTFGHLFSPLVYHPLRDAMTSVEVIKAHSTYCACVYICQLMTEYAPTYYACHTYQLAFVDFFYHCLSSDMSDASLWARMKTSKQSMWFRWFPHDTLGFIGDDLPNYMHLLWQIPLRGEVDVEQFPLMKFMIKCMPFACQRRSMMDFVVKMSETDEAFWRFLSKCMWCLLAAAYPGDGTVNMFQLLRAKQLCDNRSLLLKALARSDALERVQNDTSLTPQQRKHMKEQIKKEQESNCLVVVTAVRKYIIHMVSQYNTHYEPETIDWPSFVQETNDMARQIRQSNLFIDDAFQETRVQLARTNKLKERSVYRFHKHSCAKTLYLDFYNVLRNFSRTYIPNFKADMELMVKLLEMPAEDARTFARTNMGFGRIVQSAENVHKTLRQLLAHWQDTVMYMEYTPSKMIRERMLNLIFNMPRKERMSMEGIASVLRVVSGNSVRVKTIALVMLLIQLYHENALPKTTSTYLGEIHPKDVSIVCWYFNVVAQLEQLEYAPLPYERVLEVDEAMITVRHPLFPGQALNPIVYNVLWKMCCSELATLRGKRAYGHKDVAYNLHTRQLVCNAKQKPEEENAVSASVPDQDDDDDNEEGVSEVDDTQQKTLPVFSSTFISCQDQPVLSIPLRSVMLVVKPKGNAATAAKTFRYTRCRLCACVHEFDMLRNMVCLDCAKEDLTRHESGSWTMVYQCSYCHSGGAFGHRAGQTSRPRVRPDDVLLVHHVPTKFDDDCLFLDPEEQFQLLRFCHRCHQLAVRFVNSLTKERLFEKIHKKILKQTQNAANGIYKH